MPTQRRFSAGSSSRRMPRRPGGGGEPLTRPATDWTLVGFGLAGWLSVLLKVGLQTGVGPKAIGTAVAAPLAVLFMVLSLAGQLDDRSARVLALLWALAIVAGSVWMWL